MKIIVSAGGTGGHIYPALAIINKFKEKYKDLEVLYIGTHNRMEKDIIPTYNIPYIPIEIYGLSKTHMLRNIKNVFLIQKQIKRCKNIMKEFKPDIVLGIGGYVTYPVIKAAQELGIKTFIHEQNSIPGKTNKALAKKTTLIGVSFNETLKYFPEDKTFYSGNPCGEKALSAKQITKQSLNLPATKPLVTIVMGSLGSMSVNKIMKDYLVKKRDYSLVYITGKDYYDDFKDLKLPPNTLIYPFLDNLPGLLKSTDILVTRAGASTISEIISLQVPAIFVPSPYVANNHQYYNALELKNKKCALILEEKDLTPDSLESLLTKTLEDKMALKEMQDNLAKEVKIPSSEIIVEKIKEVL